MPPILSYASEWMQLHTLTMRLGLYNEAFVRDIARFLVTFHPPALEDVTVQFLYSIATSSTLSTATIPTTSTPASSSKLLSLHSLDSSYP